MEAIGLAWTAKKGHLPYYRMITWLFDALPESSPLCKLMIDLCAYRFDTTEDSGGEIRARSHLPRSFLLNLMLRMAEVRAKCDEGLHYDGNCDYHEHATAEEREACGGGKKGEV